MPQGWAREVIQMLPFQTAVPQRQPQAACLLLGSHFLFAFGTQMKPWVKGEGVGGASLPVAGGKEPKMSSAFLL